MDGRDNIIGKGFDARPEDINKNGRPKGSRNRSTIVREAIEAILEGTDQQVVDAMTSAIIRKASEGDVAAYRELLDSAYGKNTDKVEAEVKAEVTTKDITSKVLSKLPTNELEALLESDDNNG
jgi:metal-responsive CopG/Arc/MetJ family transcriptional regulator